MKAFLQTLAIIFNEILLSRFTELKPFIRKAL
jgi:hypothetical protein